MGVSFVNVSPTDANADRDAGPSWVLRLRGSEGPSPSVGFTWFSTNVKTSIAGQQTYIGKVSVKPVMLGIGYTHRFTRFETDLAMEAGYAFNNVRDTGVAKQAYASRLGASAVSIHASNAFAWKVDSSFWFDLGNNYGLLLSVGYLGVRPEITTSSSLGAIRQTMNLGSVVTSVGVTCAVF